MKLILSQYKIPVLQISLVTSLFVYLLIRALNLSFTHDEALSYEIITGNKLLVNTANNHFLNTWLMSTCSKLLGNLEWSLRLPNLLSFLLYAVYAFKLLAKTKLNYLYLLGTALFFLNPFIYDFFALARGYGLSLGFMMPALYYYLRIKEHRDPVPTFFFDFIRSMFFAVLALYANFALINFTIALLLLFCMDVVFTIRLQSGFGGKQFLLFMLIAALVLLAMTPAIQQLSHLKKAGELYFGAESFDQTISSLVERSFYGAPYPAWFATTLHWFLKLLLPIGLALVIYKRNFDSTFTKLTLLLVIILGGLFIEHHFFTALYPLGRTGLFLLPLLGFYCYLLLCKLSESKNHPVKRIIKGISIILVSLPLLIHFISKLNTKYTFEWRYDANTKAMMQWIETKEKSALEKEGIIIASHWLFKPGIAYFISSRQLKAVVELKEQSSLKVNYLYDLTNDTAPANFTLVKNYEDTGSKLFRGNSNP